MLGYKCRCQFLPRESSRLRSYSRLTKRIPALRKPVSLFAHPSKTLTALAPLSLHSTRHKKQIQNSMSEEQTLKQYDFTTGPFDLVSSGPATADAYDAIAGAGECVADAVSNTIYRSHIPAFWDAFLPKVTELTGSPLQVDTEATAKAKARAKVADNVKPVNEKASTYIKRLMASLDDAAKAEVTKLAQGVASALTIDVSPAAKKEGTSRGPSKDLLNKADSVLVLDADAREEKITKWSAMLDDSFTLERDSEGVPNRISLARMAGEALKRM